MKNQDQKDAGLHTPVLLPQVLMVLQPQTGESYLDLTAGYGGHADVVLQHTSSPRKTVLVDRDQQAIEVLTKKYDQSGVKIIKDDFYTASQQLISNQMQFEMILADLRVSSPLHNMASRGLSFRASGPSHTRVDQAQ